MLDDKVFLPSLNYSIKKEFAGTYLYIRKAEYPLEVDLYTESGIQRIKIKTGSHIKNLSFSSFNFINTYNGENIVDFVVSNNNFVETGLEIGGILETQARSGSGQLYKTIQLNNETKKILDFNNDRLFFSIQNHGNEAIKLGGVDVLQRFIEIEAGAKYSDSFAPINQVWVSGNGKVSIASKYKTQQEVIAPQPIEFNGNIIDFNGNKVTFYKE
jgi:hypothetical protein